MGDGSPHLGHNALSPPMPYSSSKESATCLSPVLVDVRSMMDVEGPALSTCNQFWKPFRRFNSGFFSDYVVFFYCAF